MARLLSRLAPSRHRSAVALARWLGPWAARELPQDIERREEILPGARPVRCYRYEPAAGEPRGIYLIVPGLHYAGPDDERLDRFCRVLARVGHVVLAPFLDDYLELRVAPGAAEQLALAADRAAALAKQRRLPRPALFSISFGCLPAIEVAASERHRETFGTLVVFGGYRDFFATIRFAVSGRAFRGQEPIVVPHDPSNVPAVFVNLVPFLDLPEPRDAVADAWRAMAARTWGRPELRPRDKRVPIADALAAELAPSQREPFLIGCGLRPGASERLEACLARSGDYFAFADPGPHLATLRTPLVITHGTDDDVIPWVEAEKLSAAAPPGSAHRFLLTGLYGHTGSSLPAPAVLVYETQRMMEVVYALVDAPRGG